MVHCALIKWCSAAWSSGDGGGGAGVSGAMCTGGGMGCGEVNPPCMCVYTCGLLHDTVAATSIVSMHHKVSAFGTTSNWG